MDINLVGIHITVFSFILMILLWLLQHRKDKITMQREYTQLQLTLLNKRNACFMVFRLFYSQMLKNGVCEDIIQFSLPSKVKLIELGYNQLFSVKLVGLIDALMDDALTHRTHHEMQRFDKETELFNTFIDKIKIIESQFIIESRVIN